MKRCRLILSVVLTLVLLLAAVYSAQAASVLSYFSGSDLHDVNGNAS